MPCVPEKLADLPALQQGLGQGKNLHPSAQPGRQELTPQLILRPQFNYFKNFSCPFYVSRFCFLGRLLALKYISPFL